MDKNTRILVLYTSLISGARINKSLFCLDYNISPRSFDRDIEDVRLYLSESYTAKELIYDRKENCYYLEGCVDSSLDEIEFSLFLKLLMGARVLKKDEMRNFVQKVAHHVKSAPLRLSKLIEEEMADYLEPKYGESLLKIQGDLLYSIQQQLVIKLRYRNSLKEIVDFEVIPYQIKYREGYLYLLAMNEEVLRFYRVDLIVSFTIIRNRNDRDKCLLQQYVSKYECEKLKTCEKYTFITLTCSETGYYSVLSRFEVVEAMEKLNSMQKLVIRVVESEFLAWILSQPVEDVTVIAPPTIRHKISEKAMLMIKKYS